MRILIPSGDAIIDPTIKSLGELKKRMKAGEQLPNMRIVFHGMGGRFRLTSKLARAMAGLPITDLDLGWNRVIPRAIAELEGLPIRGFTLMGSGLTPKVATALKRLPVDRLSLSTCSFTVKTARSLKGSSLKILILKECSGVSAKTLEELGEMHLGSLTLHHFPQNTQGRQLSVGVFEQVARFDALTHLDLGGSFITLEMVNKLTNTGITRLGLAHCQLTEPMFEAFGQMPIVELDLAHCRLTLEILRKLATLVNLRYLDLSNVPLSQPMLDLLANLFPAAERIPS